MWETAIAQSWAGCAARGYVKTPMKPFGWVQGYLAIQHAAGISGHAGEVMDQGNSEADSLARALALLEESLEILDSQNLTEAGLRVSLAIDLLNRMHGGGDT